MSIVVVVWGGGERATGRERERKERTRSQQQDSVESNSVLNTYAYIFE